MAKRPKSEALAALHETMLDLHSVGAIDDRRMRDVDESCLVDDESDAAGARYVVFKDARGTWRWRLLSKTGNVLAESGQDYETERDALESIDLVRKAAHAVVAGVPAPT